MEYDPFKLSIPIQVRFSDLDALGHVNNVTYFTYFEIARVKYLDTGQLRNAWMVQRWLAIAATLAGARSRPHWRKLRWGREKC
jgi:acyl-CoA thioesterase FadM